ncbi:hypothetical protein ACFYN0_26530 [Streptomyces sp. NPDC006704]|uniref:hypothetical protein n=1 Tax=Streptomyces sp. NPDC006704 TaxID=3364760 RepID=UPI0036969CE2
MKTSARHRPGRERWPPWSGTLCDMTIKCTFATMDLEIVDAESVFVEIQHEEREEQPGMDVATYALHIGDQLVLMLPQDTSNRERLMLSLQDAIADVLAAPSRVTRQGKF